MSVGTSTHSTSILNAAIWATVSPTNFVTQVVQVGIKPHDRSILASVQTLVHGRDSQDAGG
jgi:hypothetical protein